MTSQQRRLSWLYLIYRIVSNMWFVGAVWLYFYRLFITDQQVGVLDGMAFAIGLIAEVPSGALADKFGRDKLVRLGYILAGIGFFIQAFGSSFFPFFFGQSVVMIGMSFVSGADEALFFENLKFDSTSLDWRKLSMRASQAALIGPLLANMVGGLLHTVNPRIPWMLTGMSFFVSAILIWSVKDNRPRNVRQKISIEIKDYIRDIQLGFAQFTQSRLALYVPVILTVQGLFYATGWGLLRLVLLDRFHFSPFWGAIVITLCSITTVLGLSVLHRVAEKISEKRMLTVISLLAVASLLLSLTSIGSWGFFVILILHAGEHILYPFMSEILNRHAPEQQRATVLSVASFLRMLPYVLLAPIIGYLNYHGKLAYFLIVWAVCIGIAVTIYLLAKKQDAKIRIDTMK